MASLSKQDKQIREDWIKDQVEYKNPNLPWNRPSKISFPAPTSEELERMKNLDMYGNPKKESTEPILVEDLYGNLVPMKNGVD